MHVALYHMGLHRSIETKFMTINLKTKLLCINFNVCFGCSEETSHRGDSFEFPQHVFWLINKKNPHFFLLRTFILGPGPRDEKHCL